MRFRILFSVLWFVASALPVSAAEFKTTVDPNMHFRPLPHADNIEFRWKRYPKPKAFVEYELVRLQTQGTSTIELVLSSTDNRYSTNAMDAYPQAGENKYRLCVTTKTGRVCSKTVKVNYKGRVRQPPIVAEVSLETTTSTLPTPEILTPPAGAMLLTTTTTSSTTDLAWTPNSSQESFRYVLVRSQSNPSLSYPSDGYLARLHPDAVSFVDPEILAGTVYYRVCAVDLSERLYCGNIASVSR
jgi:hypothetical protein